MTALQGYNIHLHTPWRGIRLETMIRQFVRRNSAISSVARRSFGSGGGATSMSVFDYETITAGGKWHAPIRSQDCWGISSSPYSSHLI